MFTRFFSQPCHAYRDFQLAYLVLALNFLIPGMSYLIDPSIAIGQLDQLGALLGSGPMPLREESLLWRILAGCNVLTLGVMCSLLLVDLRRFHPVLWPLCFMKASTALAFLMAGFVTAHRVFPAIFVFDGLTTAAFIFFAGRARRAIDGFADAELVPLPLSSRHPDAWYLPRATRPDRAA